MPLQRTRDRAARRGDGGCCDVATLHRLHAVPRRERPASTHALRRRGTARAHARLAEVSLDDLLVLRDPSEIGPSPFDPAAAARRRVLEARALPSPPDPPPVRGTWVGTAPNGVRVEVQLGTGMYRWNERFVEGLVQFSHVGGPTGEPRLRQPALDRLEEFIRKSDTAVRAQLRMSFDPGPGYDPRTGYYPGNGYYRDWVDARPEPKARFVVDLLLRPLAPGHPVRGGVEVAFEPDRGERARWLALRPTDDGLSTPETLTAPVALGGTGVLEYGPDGSPPPSFEGIPRTSPTPDAAPEAR